MHLLLPASLVVGVLFARLGSGGVVSGVALYGGSWALGAGRGWAVTWSGLAVWSGVWAETAVPVGEGGWGGLDVSATSGAPAPLFVSLLEGGLWLW